MTKYYSLRDQGDNSWESWSLKLASFIDYIDVVIRERAPEDKVANIKIAIKALKREKIQVAQYYLRDLGVELGEDVLE